MVALAGLECGPPTEQGRSSVLLTVLRPEFLGAFQMCVCLSVRHPKSFTTSEEGPQAIPTVTSIL